jgi:translation initiation factor 2B subunit (eIF-2B alpha/beta/delta family)
VVTVLVSSTVRVCLEAFVEHLRVEVICAEARPLMEGRQTATALGAAGLGVPNFSEVVGSREKFIFVRQFRPHE